MADRLTHLVSHPDLHADDAILVERALEGGAWAKTDLFKRHAPRLLGLLTRLLSSVAEAEDAAQDTFVLAFADLGKLREPARFGAWLTRIAVHQAHRRFRRRRVLRALGLGGPSLDATFDQVADPRASVEARAELANLQRVLDGLPVAERAAWMLRHVEGYELADIAALLDVSLATAKRRLSAGDDSVQTAMKGAR